MRLRKPRSLAIDGETVTITTTDAAWLAAKQLADANRVERPQLFRTLVNFAYITPSEFGLQRGETESNLTRQRAAALVEANESLRSMSALFEHLFHRAQLTPEKYNLVGISTPTPMAA